VAAVVILVAGLVLGIYLATSTTGGGPYRASITSLVALSRAETSVTIHVTNTGQEGTPTCDIHLRSENGLYTGSGTITARNALAEGEEASYRDNVTVRNPRGRFGASQVTIDASRVTCS
jgi:hypothetical protein